MSVWQSIVGMQPGAARRKALLDYLATDLSHPSGIPVNRSWCLNLKYDSDLNYLLKKKLLVRVRVGSYRCQTTYLRLA